MSQWLRTTSYGSYDHQSDACHFDAVKMFVQAFISLLRRLYYYNFQTTFEDVLVCVIVLTALLTLFLSLSTEHVVFFVCYVSLQFLD